MVTGGNATVYIHSMDAALDFYTRILGMTVTSHFGDDWATVAAGGFTVGLHPKDGTAPEPGTAGAIIVGLMVDDIEAGRSKLMEGGAQEVGEVVKGDGGSFVQFQDPDGNALYLWQMAQG